MDGASSSNEERFEDPLSLPPTSCDGWIRQVLHCLSAAAALRLERTSRSWRSWLGGAEAVWERIARESGVTLSLAGPLARYVAVANWRRLCVECVGELSRELRGGGGGGGGSAGGPGGAARAGDIVVLRDGSVGEALGFERTDPRYVRVRVAGDDATRAAPAAGARVLRPRSEAWWRAVARLRVDDCAARAFCEGVAGCVESQPIQDTFNLSVPERIFGVSLSSRRELGERIRTVQESWETSSI